MTFPDVGGPSPGTPLGRGPFMKRILMGRSVESWVGLKNDLAPGGISDLGKLIQETEFQSPAYFRKICVSIKRGSEGCQKGERRISFGVKRGQKSARFIR